MKILNINSNFHQSAIHNNIIKAMNNIDGIDNRVFFPVDSKKLIDKYNCDFLDLIYCLKRCDKLFYYKRNKKLFKIINNEYDIKEYNYILAHSLFSNGMLANTISKKYNISYTVIVTNTDLNLYFKYMRHLKNQGVTILKEADKIIFSTSEYRDLIIEKYIPEEYKKNILEKSLCIPFGIDNFWIDNRRVTTKKLNNKKIKLLYVGKINKNKNIEKIIEACDEIIRNEVDIEFTVVGGICKKSDKKILDRIVKKKYVTYKENMPFEQLKTYYENNDIFIMVSRKESFGLVYAEAMSQGLPVIYSKGQGFDKQFEDYSIGIPVNCNSIEEIVDAIYYIRNNYEVMSQEACKKSIRFKWSKISREIIDGLQLQR